MWGAPSTPGRSAILLPGPGSSLVFVLFFFRVLNDSADVSLMVAFESTPRIGASFNTKLGAPGAGEVACR